MEMKNKYVHEAYSAIFQQDFKRATDSFCKAIRIQPKNHALYYKLSITYARNNKLEKAIHSISEAISLSEGNYVYLLHLQTLLIRKVVSEAKSALTKKQDVSKYIPELTKYIELDPLHLELKWIMGLIFLSLGEYTKADEQMEAIIQVDPEHPHALQYIISRSEQDNNDH
jgi:tetratricopeptide (TPR) repeat protein